MLRADAVVRLDGDGHAEALLHLDQCGALVVEHVERGGDRSLDRDVMPGILEQEFLDPPHHQQRHRGVGTDMARAATMRAGLHGRFEHRGADALAAHLHEAEMRDAADLNAGAVVLEAILQLLLDRPVVPVLLHVDEVDDDQSGEVAQAQLPRHFLRRFQIGLERGVLDVVLARRAAGVDVDGDQRLGLVDDEVSAALQRHLRLHHPVELRLDAGAREDGRRVAIGLDHLGVARHQHAHEILGLAIAFVAGNQDFVDVLVVEIANRALDQRPFLIDEGRGAGLKRQAADIFPQPHQVFVVALDLRLGAALAGGAQDDAHALRHFEVGNHFLEALAVLRIGDLARDAAAARGIGHQHRIAAGEREIGSERRALVAALFLDHLHEQDLPALDDFLDLVLAARRLAARAHFVERVLGADRLDFVAVAVRGVVIRRVVVIGGVMVVAALVGGFPGLVRDLFRYDLVIGVGSDGDVGFLIEDGGLGRVAVDSGRLVIVNVLCGVPVRCVFGGARFVAMIAVAAAAAAAASLAALLPLLAGVLFVLLVFGFLRFRAQQRLTIGDRDLVVVGMDFAEGEETVPVSAIFDEGCLKGRFDAGYAGEVDVSFELLLVLGFEIKFFDTVTANDNDAGFLRVGGVYQHFVGHYCVSPRQPPATAGRVGPIAVKRGCYRCRIIEWSLWEAETRKQGRPLPLRRGSMRYFLFLRLKPLRLSEPF